MATNPMAKKARNSFFLGVILMLIISLIAAIAFYILVYKKGSVISGDDKVVYAYRLTQDVKYGDEITASMVEPVTVSEKVAPAGTFPSKTQNNKKWVDQPYYGGYKAKVDLKAGTILAQTLTYTEDLRDDLRLAEYNMLTLPTTLNIGDYIDVRLSLGSGQDFIVISKKQIKNILGNTITLNLTEEDMLLMNSSIVEAYAIKTANLYVVQYIDSSMQEEPKNTYVPTAEVIALINADGNILKTAKDALKGRLEGANAGVIRQIINTEKEQYSDQEILQEKIKTQMENSRKAREAYLSGLATY